MVRTLVSRASHIGVARLCVLAELHEAVVDRLLLGDVGAQQPGHGLRQARPSRSSSSSAAGGPQVPAA